MSDYVIIDIIKCIERLFGKERSEVKVGQVYELISDNPFVNYMVRVADVKDGYVLTSNGKSWPIRKFQGPLRWFRFVGPSDREKQGEKTDGKSRNERD